MMNIKDKFLFKENGGNIFYYSERGVMDYFYKTIADSAKGIRELKKYLKVNEAEQSKLDAVKKLEIIGEIELGKNGFGSPDGIIFGLDDEDEIKLMMFIEAKVVSYDKSVKTCFKTDKDHPEQILVIQKGYNSTIKGQLELKYRFLRAFFTENNKKNQEPGDLDLNIYEPKGIANAYRNYDIKYKEDIDLSVENNRRHLLMERGLEHLARRIQAIPYSRLFYILIKKVLFVAATNETGIKDQEEFINKYNNPDFGNILPEFKLWGEKNGNRNNRIAFLNIKKFIKDKIDHGIIKRLPNN